MKRTLRIADPCSERWESMRGEGSLRLCDACHKQVHDLSRLTVSETERLLASAPPGGICVRVDHTDDGAIRFRPGGAGVRAVMTLAVGASLVVAGCKPAEDTRVTPAPERAQTSAPLAQEAPPPGQEAVPAEDAGTASKASPTQRSKTTKTIGCVCVENDPLCSCL
jgi:hypothetical protein